MTALATFPQVGKMVLMLSSNQPGEIVAAANAIDRTLRNAGHDWHDLVRAIEIGAATMTKPPRKGEPVIEPVTEQDIARYVLGRQAELSAQERDFVRTIMKRMAYGDSITDKQSRWLKAIFMALGGATQ